MKRYFKNFLIFSVLVLSFVLAGCKDTKIDTISPNKVAAEFWKYYMDNKLQRAKELTVYKNIDKPVIPKGMKIKSFQIGEVFKKDGLAEVNTTLKLIRKDNPQDEIDINFKTVLLLIGNNWRVDFDKTSQNLMSEVARLGAEEISDTIMNLFLNGAKNVKEFEKIFQKSFEEINEKMQKALEQMQKELEKMEREENNSSKSPVI